MIQPLVLRLKTKTIQGAPETYRSTDLQTSHLQVTQSVDIWSVGCVLSEVVTWVTEGSTKLQEYRRRRQQEVATKSNISEDRFHYNWQVLNTVKELHEDTVQNKRANDHVTSAVVQKLIEGMIVPDPRYRGAAQYFLEQSNTILEMAHTKLNRISDNILHPRVKRMPPNLPAVHQTQFHSGFGETESDASSLEQAPRPQHIFTQLQKRNNRTSMPQGSRGQELLQHSTRHNEGDVEAIPFGNAESRYQQPNVFTRRTDRILSYPSTGSKTSEHHGYASVSKAAVAGPIPQFSFSGVATNGHSDMRSSLMGLRPRELRESPPAFEAPPARRISSEDHFRSPHDGSSEPLEQSSHASSPSVPALRDSDVRPLSHYKRVPSDQPLPYMVVSKGLAIKRDRDRGKNVKYPDHHDFQIMDAILRKRDHVSLSLSLLHRFFRLSPSIFTLQSRLIVVGFPRR